MSKFQKLVVNETEIALTQVKGEDFICLTHMMKAKDGDFFISDWLRNSNTLEYLAAWETMSNPDFNYGEFAIIRNASGVNSFKISVKEWVSRTKAIGVQAKTGRYGGTYAHKDIAFNFGMWISPVFQLYIVKEYQRLKEAENNEYNLEWDVRRLMTKVNYVLHTDAVQKHIIPKSTLPEIKKGIEYATEADLLNLAVYGYTAKQWKESNPKHALNNKNMRDFSSITDLLIMQNIETVSSELIKRETSRSDRFKYLKKMADELRAQFDKVDIMKSLKKTNANTYIDADNMTPDQIESESKKDILEANKKNLSKFNQNLVKATKFNPNAPENKKKK